MNINEILIVFPELNIIQSIYVLQMLGCGIPIESGNFDILLIKLHKSIQTITEY